MICGPAGALAAARTQGCCCPQPTAGAAAHSDLRVCISTIWPGACRCTSSTQAQAGSPYPQPLHFWLTRPPAPAPPTQPALPSSIPTLTPPRVRSEQLRAEGERRARQFQAAVQAAAGKIEADLLAELDAVRDR